MAPMPPGWTRTTSPWHAGEIAAQERAGVRHHAERAGRIGIRDAMPDQHRAFFATLPFLIVGARDRQGRPWAAILEGPPGFVRSPDPLCLTAAAALPPGHPLDGMLVPGAPVGVLGLQPETRRRNRVNGRIAAADGDRIAIAVDQSFGNCPKYIRTRTVTHVGRPPGATPRLRPEGAILSPAAEALVRSADTFFVASASPGAGGDDPREGVDVSHRGGRPGFVALRQEDGHSVLVIPDYVGNAFFNTVGNILRDPAAGLLFVDDATGDTLMLTGRAEVVWESEEIARVPGAQRLLRFAVTEGVAVAGASALRWTAGPPAPQLATEPDASTLPPPPR
ncbi:pyridoxamine 5'-phosphate oxidase family protein [Rhodoplanes sp. TEM]|uniref:Pyridoxamine 5'-phosphate oxidase family protein n=1 Tax=Rhodoplanes tepidamans TaxID=200616 RepID=A0ABT5JDT8_RHOTP|nr:MULTISPECIES: pyridoxamine 5'-phosphate oxidase family protein [Rhodoplanes]MDC7787769.1 pyridoxamine 5'-phosphate oxidase family protein [Rhodoplanes tepidamans]MDC7982668.1 pyridoxamine 5'-phosphate oxidase family protein [Rhodoplanes sp. TEM]MDQ0357685.1 putative pyridoxine 5'-phosphate oxidase superfamily flavin-nucleotide-binding protein [Rhodoplanes tepidamans]